MTTKYANVKFNIDTAETGKRLKELRKKHHITINELSWKSGLSKAMISETEAGKNKPSPNLMLALTGIKIALLKTKAKNNRISKQGEKIIKTLIIVFK